MSNSTSPLIVLTVTDVARHRDRDLAARKNARYADEIVRHGGRPRLLDETTTDDEREAAFAAMDGLLLTGGADIDPARYGQPNKGSTAIEPERDELEAAAWAQTERRSIPVFGICRGFQAINVFAGGSLLQHVPDHAGPAWSTGPAKMHPIRIAPGSALAGALAGDRATVNTYHHQAVTAAGLAPSLVATAWAASDEDDIVEAFERPGERFILGVQCHPERTEFSPIEFERVWSAFVRAARDRAATKTAASAR